MSPTEVDEADEGINARRRLESLRETQLMDSPREECFDRLTRLVSQFLRTPVALVSLVDDRRQFFKSCVGLPREWDERRETPLSHSFCRHVVNSKRPLVIDDARESPLVRDNLAIRDLGVIAYIGAPILAPSGEVLGSFCAVDTVPRRWSEADLQVITDLVESVNTVIAYRVEAREKAEAEHEASRFRSLVEQSVDFIAMMDLEGTIRYLNPAGRLLVGMGDALPLNGLKLADCFSHPSSSLIEREAIARTRSDGRWNGAGRLREVPGHGRLDVEANLFLMSDRTTGAPEGLAAILCEVSSALRAERRQVELASLVENSHDLVGLLDSVGRFTFLNRAGRAMLGVRHDSELEIGWDAIDPTAGPEHFLEQIVPVVRERGRLEYELSRTSGRTGEALHLRIDLFLVPDPLDEHESLFGVAIKDVSDAKESRVQLEHERARSLAILESALDCVVTMNHEGCIVEFNPSAERTFGYSREQALGRPLADLLVPPELREAHRAGLRHYLATGHGPALGRRLVLDGCRSDGSRIPLEIAITAVPLEGPPLFTAFLRDITERIEKEKLLQESEARFRGSFDNAPIGMALRSVEGRWTRVNRAIIEILGFSESELLNGDPQGFAFAADRPDDRSLTQRCLAGEISGYKLERRYRHKHDHEVWISSSVSLVRDERGDPLFFIDQMQDVTERKRIEEALRQAKDAAEAASRSKSEFLANMSHEVRTPIAAILGNAEILLDPEIDDRQREQGLRAIRKNGGHLLQIISDILDLSKIEAGKLELESIDYSPWQIVQEVHTALALKAEEHGIRFEVSSAGPLPDRVRIDPTRFRQVLVNLVSNAVKFTPAGKTVRVKMRFTPTGSRWGPELVVDVIDEGIGMSSEQISRLFRPFQQGDSSMSRRYGGTGLGLTISKRLVEALEGSIEVESDLGVGSRFTVRIPARSATFAEDRGAASRGRHHERSDPSTTEPAHLQGRILLAEDSPDNRRVLLYYLKKAGLVPEIAENGVIAVEKALGGDFDLILMDMQMPECDGYEAASRLRRSGFDRPIIALTAHALSSDRDRCIAAGCSDYLAKPVKSSDLIACVARHLIGSRNDSSQRPTEGSSDHGDSSAGFARLVADYVAGLPATVAAVRDACARGDLTTLRTLAHQMRGVAGMYGFHELGESAGLVESALIEGRDSDLIAELVEELSRIAAVVVGGVSNDGSERIA
ncbi:MAG: PAS domain S-box protein [Isosphaeraceae bacterium]|nr:PAS domain S-box protein [Isosphaeraceae bacterium]